MENSNNTNDKDNSELNNSNNNEDNDNYNYSYQDNEIKNLCLDCGVDMGPCNPRQLCGKTHCNNI